MLCSSRFSKESVVNEVFDLQTSSKVEKDNTILVFGKGSLHAVSSIHGEIVWKIDFPSERFVLLNFTHQLSLFNPSPCN